MHWGLLFSTVVLAVALAAAVYFYLSGAVSIPLAPKQPTLLLVGPSNSGKTTLFQKLVYGKKRASTYTSQRANTGNLVLDSGNKITVVDFPGHSKLFGGFKSFTPTCITFVLDSSTFSKNADVVSRSFLEVLTFARRMNVQEVSILANKSDFFTALSEEKIIELIEIEIEQIRNQRDGVQMDSIEEKTESDEEENWLQDLPGPFKLKDECMIISGSVLKDDITLWQEWVQSSFS